jgi:lipid II:glycine glycyltransferase (peptidoglycan interpeptide bridge formation enzyme)
METIGGIHKTPDFFRQIPTFLQNGSWEHYVAKLNGENIASLLLLYGNQTVEYFTPATKNEYRKLQPLSLIIFTAMKDAIDRKFTKWNWGGTWKTQTGVYDFKKRWGVLEGEYRYYCAVFKPEILTYPIDFIKQGYPNFYVFPFEDSTEQPAGTE